MSAFSNSLSEIAQQADRRQNLESEELQPVFGSPALVYHVAVSPAQKDDPQDAKDVGDYRKRFKKWYDKIDAAIYQLIDRQDNAKDNDILIRKSHRFEDLKALINSVQRSPGGGAFKAERLPCRSTASNTSDQAVFSSGAAHTVKATRAPGLSTRQHSASANSGRGT